MWNRLNSGTRQIIFLTIIVLLLRVVIIDLYQQLEGNFGFRLYDFVIRILVDYRILALILVANILFAIKLNRNIPFGREPIKRLLISLLYVVGITIVVTVIVNFSQLLQLGENPSFRAQAALSALAALLINTLIIVVADVVLYYRSSRQALIIEANKKHKAQYQYSQLKQQLNPHFLFNSLNILDYLIHNGDQDRASDFIRKLAGVYRYLLNTAENRLVPLSEEIRFVNMYAELLKERFTDGLEIEIDVPENLMQRMVVPCGLQTLVENATKHNVVSADRPLSVRISIEDDMLVTKNNTQLKIRRDDSTGVGLTNINLQYKDISGKEIIILDTKKEFTVKLPLL